MAATTNGGERDWWGGSLSGRVVVVTGAGTGLGATLARRFAAAGARPVLVARSERSLTTGAAAARAAGGDPVTVAADVTSADDLARAAAVVDGLGGADVLVNSAFPTPTGGAVLDLDADGLASWRAAMETGGWGTLLACRAFVPAMVAKGAGSVVNVTSMSSRVAHAGRSEYAAGKVQSHRIAQALAEEVGPAGVRVNCVAPGHILSDVLQGWYRTVAERRGVTYEDVLAEVTAAMALRRIATEDEVANAVLFLASDLASGITGAVIDVNAGNYFTP